MLDIRKIEGFPKHILILIVALLLPKEHLLGFGCWFQAHNNAINRLTNIM